jgi:hypothetical protein
MAGFTISLFSLLVAFGYLVAKLIFWNELQLGTAPLLIGIYFFGAVQLFFIGILGEYIGSIHTQVHKRPLVVEKERINFDRAPDSGLQPLSRNGVADGLPALVAVATEEQQVVRPQRADEKREVPEVLGPVIEADSEDRHVGSNGA